MALALLLATSASVAWPERAPQALVVETPTFGRDARIQAKISAVARAGTEDQLEVALAELRAAVEPDFSDLVLQLAWFLLDADGERAGMTPAVIVARLGVSHAQILRAVEPHLDAPEAALRAQLENLLEAVPNEDVRTFLVERAPVPPSPALVRFLYERSPADAVVLLRESSREDAERPAEVRTVEELRAQLRAGRASEEQTARGAAALRELARDPDWRMRAYAAAVLRADGSLAAAGGDARARLSVDPDPRVRALLPAPAEAR